MMSDKLPFEPEGFEEWGPGFEDIDYDDDGVCEYCGGEGSILVDGDEVDCPLCLGDGMY
jgi:hypothetical protein